MHRLTEYLMVAALFAMALGELLGIAFHINWAWILAFGGFFTLLATGVLYAAFVQGKPHT